MAFDPCAIQSAESGAVLQANRIEPVVQRAHLEGASTDVRTSQRVIKRAPVLVV